MYRKSIYETKERFSEAVKQVYSLKELGSTEEDIPKKLSGEYQESEIINLINNIHKLPSINGNLKLKKILKGSLWFLLIIKFISIPDILILNDFSMFWKITITIIMLLSSGGSLYLIYKEFHFSYGVVFYIQFIIFIVLSNGIFNKLEMLFSAPISFPIWWIDLLTYLANVSVLFTAGKLMLLYPDQLLRLHKVVTTENLNYL